MKNKILPWEAPDGRRILRELYPHLATWEESTVLSSLPTGSGGALSTIHRFGAQLLGARAGCPTGQLHRLEACWIGRHPPVLASRRQRHGGAGWTRGGERHVQIGHVASCTDVARDVVAGCATKRHLGGKGPVCSWTDG
jgi:hypothetical protein